MLKNNNQPVIKRIQMADRIVRIEDGKIMKGSEFHAEE